MNPRPSGPVRLSWDEPAPADLLDHLGVDDDDSPAVGSLVTGTPVGRTRKQTMQVTAVDLDAGLVHGLLVSRKHPGDFRGSVSMWLDEVKA